MTATSKGKRISPPFMHAPERKYAVKKAPKLGKPIVSVEPIYSAIGARCAYIRSTLGVTQAEIAKRLNMERTSLVNFEAGKQRFMLHKIEELARALGTTPKHLLRGLWL